MKKSILCENFCRKNAVAIFVMGMVACVSDLRSQTIPVGQLDLDHSLRTLQLTGAFDRAYSFAARPFYQPSTGRNKENTVESDTIDPVKRIDANTFFSSRKYVYNNGKITLALQPVTFVTKFNSHNPYGWNDEGMIAAKGLQTQFSAGVFARMGPVSVQLQPQFVYAANPQFDTSASFGSRSTGAYQKIFAGQSSVRLNVGALSAGYSSENIWWGPGQFSSLLMSNNAPGFMHFTLNTTRPVKTPIGSFEFQIIGGRLDEDSSANRPWENRHLKRQPLSEDWRYINGIVLSYQPSFMPDLFVGLTRSFQLYHTDFVLQPSFIEQYLPVFTALFKNSTENEDIKGRDQTISIFSRMVFPRSHAEVYFEYGWNDHSANARDFLGDPEHSAAYLLGGKKLVPLNKARWLEFSGEITQMAQGPDYVVRNAGNWYEHSKVLQGLTHQNQILGAGSGMGNNVQTLTANWIDGIKKMGLIFQRIQHDPSALAGTPPNILLREKQWTETAIGIQTRWDFGKFLASADVQYTWSKNYAWEPDKNAGNLYALLKIAYSW